jgi:hypothetical protein
MLPDGIFPDLLTQNPIINPADIAKQHLYTVKQHQN